nr:reverse transcriptase domain-containing protein [Tanacetum cinerariifolium]
MSTPTFAKTHNLIAYLAKPTESKGFEQIINFLNGSSVSYALTVGDMSHHKDIYDNPSLTKKVFANIKRVGTSFYGVVTALFDNMLVPAAKEVGLPDLIPTQMTLELVDRAICTPNGIARDVFVPIGKLTFLADFVVVDYESDPRVPLILGRPFLRKARALIDVHGEEMILRDGDERLTLNTKHNTASYSNHPYRESVKLINIFNLSTNSLLEKFADELALISYPLDYDDYRVCDIESDIREIEFLLFQVKIITHVTQEKKLAVSFASWLFEDFDPPFSELLVFKEVLNSMRLLPFSFENEEKVFKPRIYTFKKVHCCFLSELSHPASKKHPKTLFSLTYSSEAIIHTSKNDVAKDNRGRIKEVD